MRHFFLFILLFILSSCVTAPSTPSATGPAQPFLLPSPQAVPPTFTPLSAVARATVAPIPTQPPQETAVPDTPIPFDDVVVSLQIQIPAIQLNRSLEGTIGSKLTLIDTTSGKGQERSHQGAILLQLQQALKNLELTAVPAECDRCVQLSFQLPLEGKDESGWLQDDVLLASIENLMSIALGAHFPPEAVAGLRRTASPFSPAQTIVLMPDGRLWVWQANKDIVPEPLSAEPTLFETATDAIDATLATEYSAACSSVPLETLLLNEGGDVQKISIVCPEFALPTPLLPLYLQFDQIMAQHISENLERPPSTFPIAALLDYQLSDGSQLTLYEDGTAVAIDTSGSVFTDTITHTAIISLTTSLIESGTVQLGLATFIQEESESETPEPPKSRLLVRGISGVYDGAWANVREVVGLTAVADLLTNLIHPVENNPEPTPTP